MSRSGGQKSTQFPRQLPSPIDTAVESETALGDWYVNRLVLDSWRGWRRQESCSIAQARQRGAHRNPHSHWSVQRAPGAGLAGRRTHRQAIEACRRGRRAGASCPFVMSLSPTRCGLSPRRRPRRTEVIASGGTQARPAGAAANASL